MDPNFVDNVSADGQAMPSRGSALHGTLRCSPCAWYWKTKGCQNGAACDYCHLCPEGELKNRKKQKVAQIKQGNADAALPKGAGQVPVVTAATVDAGAASRSLNLSSLLK